MIRKGKPNPPKKKRITTSSAKAKGRSLQTWTCQKISDILGLPWGKDELIASREMGQSGVDVRLIGEAKTRFPFSVECKNCEAWHIPAWIEQAKSNQAEEMDWLLIVKRNGMKPIVVMDGKRFFELMDRLV